MLISDVRTKDDMISAEDMEAFKTTLAYAQFGDDSLHKSFAELEAFLGAQLPQVADYVNAHVQEHYRLSGMYVLLRHAQVALSVALDRDVRTAATNVQVVYMTFKCAYELAQELLSEDLKLDPSTPYILAVIMSASVSLRFLIEAMVNDSHSI